MSAGTWDRGGFFKEQKESRWGGSITNKERVTDENGKAGGSQITQALAGCEENFPPYSHEPANQRRALSRGSM